MKAKGEEKERQVGMNISNIQGNFQPSGNLTLMLATIRHFI